MKLLPCSWKSSTIKSAGWQLTLDGRVHQPFQRDHAEREYHNSPLSSNSNTSTFIPQSTFYASILLPIFKISLRLWTATEILRLFGNVWWQKPLLCLEQSSLPPNCQFFAQPILFSKAASSNINFILQDNDFIWQKAVSSSLQVKTVLSVFAFIADLQTSQDPDHKRPLPPVHSTPPQQIITSIYNRLWAKSFLSKHYYYWLLLLLFWLNISVLICYTFMDIFISF